MWVAKRKLNNKRDLREILIFFDNQANTENKSLITFGFISFFFSTYVFHHLFYQ